MSDQTQPTFPTPAPQRKRRWPWLVTAAAVALVALCIGGSVALFSAAGDELDQATGQATQLPTTPAATSPEAAPVAEPSTEAPVADDGPAPFGRANGWKYEDGLVVSVDKVARFKPNSWAAGHTPGNTAVKVAITIINKTGSAFDCSMMTVNAAYGPTGVQAEQVFDSDASIGTCDGKIANGRSRTVWFGFSAKAAPSPLQIGVAPSWDHDESLFEGKA